MPDGSQRVPMAEDLTFLMGKFPAVLPGDLRYARNHMWCRQDQGRQRFGFTTYAVRLMQDVYFLDWVISAGDAVLLLQQVGHIETSKAVADLFAPMVGTVVASLLTSHCADIGRFGENASWHAQTNASALRNWRSIPQFEGDLPRASHREPDRILWRQNFQRWQWRDGLGRSVRRHRGIRV